jgi:hypothetical protein
MANSKWQRANNRAVAGAAKLDLITASLEFQGL